MNPLRFCPVLHNHQPVGNFDSVFVEAYENSYLPFLDVFESFEHLRLSLHISGSLAEWLEQNRPNYLDRIADLVSTGRIEIIGGGFYEPILTMIPAVDRRGQITRYSRWLQDRFGQPVRGMWVAERVWEPMLAGDISRAGIEYTVLDDFHFRNAGLSDDHLGGSYLTEEEGQRLTVFPGSEQLRYLIPFQDPQQTIDHLRGIAEGNSGGVVVFADDGEKFGSWPETRKHVYDDGWLKRFFQLLTENRQWLDCCTLGEAVDAVRPLGKIFLPDSSYREMTEWSLPVSRQRELAELSRELDNDERWPRIRSFIRGGLWRNFRVKYREADLMYCRMLSVSRRIQQCEKENLVDEAVISQAREDLYRGQCNCAYWHGAFGGIYLPHLRHAVYRHLIRADSLIERSIHEGKWVEARGEDFDIDGRAEIRLANEALVALISPHRGGQLFELDVRSVELNLLATMKRYDEAYHDQVRNGQNQQHDETASIHDRIVFKQEDLDQQLFLDNLPRTSLIDHFWDDDVCLDDIHSGGAMERGDFTEGDYDATIRTKRQRVQVQMSRKGNAWGIPLRLTKGITLNAGSHQLEIAYLIEEIPGDREFHFGVEFNFSGLPINESDRYYCQPNGERLGQLDTRLDLADAKHLCLVDRWLGLEIGLEINRSSGIWTFPVQTVNQSEGGFELVHQSIAVQPHWLVRGDANGRWSVEMKIDLRSRLDRLAQTRPDNKAVATPS